MPVPVDPYPDFVNGTTVADGDQVDQRFKTLYDMFDPSQTGISEDNLNGASVGTTQLVDHAVTAAKIEVQQPWQVLAVPAIGNLNYYKDSLGIVHVQAIPYVTAAAIVANAGLASFPAGYRPGGPPNVFPLWAPSIGAALFWSVNSAGGLAVGPSNIPAGTQLVLMGGLWRAEG